MNGGGIIGLTGTPIVHRPTDLWSEFDVLWPGDRPQDHVLGFGNYWAFEGQVAIVRPHPHLGNRVRLYEFPPERLEVLKSRVAPHALEETKDMCLDLPPRTFDIIKVDMLPEQRAVYDALRDDMVAFLENGKVKDNPLLEKFGVPLVQNPDFFIDDPGMGDDRRVSVAFATTLMIRLHTIASGFVKRDDGVIVDFPNAKIELLREMIPLWTEMAYDSKLILFTVFRHDIEILMKLFREMKVGAVSLNGDNAKEANDVVKVFQTNPKVRVFVGNLQVASAGLNIVKANYMTFYNNSFNNGRRMQALDRNYRIGQTRKVTVYDILAKNTVDERVYENGKEKQKLAIATVGNLIAALKS